LKEGGAVPAISVGSVEVDVVPNARGVRQSMQRQMLPAADEVGEELARIIGRHLSSQIGQGIVRGITQGGRTALPAATRQGESTGGAFARAARARIQAALRDLPDIRIDADSTPAQREIAAIRTQLRSLTEVDIGIDIDSAEAQARISQLQARLDRLSASDVDVQTRMDTAAASAQLAAFQAQVNRLDGQTANVDVDTRSATASMSALTSAALLFGPAILPVLPVVAAGLGAIAAAATAAGVGLGAVGLVAIPAFKQISGVLQAQKAAQDAATAATQQGGQAAAQAASRANQLASAQAAVASAERNGAKQIAAAQQQVSQARRNAAQTAAQASQRAQQAARQVEDAEEALADAQRDARRAQEDLTAARRTAARELQDLNSQLAGAQLDQRQSVLDLQDAERELRAVQEKGSAATAGELQRAQLNYDRAKQAVADQATETKRLEQETKAANKAGVEGSETVKSAQERLAEAQETAADKTQALKDAQAEQARTATENAQSIADAQQRIADAQRGVADAQVQAAEQAASAQRSLSQAQQAGAGSVDQAAIAQAKYQAELAKLTPAARDTMDAYVGLKGAFSAWSKSLQPAVMPIFTRALNAMGRALPGLTPFVLEAASAIQTLMDKASKELKSPFWTKFKDDLEKSVKPAIIGFGVGFGNVFKGIAGIIDGFLPHMDSISERMQRVTGRFADWGASLKGSPEFEKFLAYSSEMAPKLWDTLKKIAGAVIDVASAMKPITSIVLQILGGLAQGISWVAVKAPWVIQLIYGIVAAMTAWRLATLLWTGVTWLATAAMSALSLVVNMSPFGRIVLLILAVAGAIYLLWTKCDWFRGAVQAVWDGIKAGGQAVADWFSGPFVRFFTETIPGAFRSALDWVKNNWPWILVGLTGPIGLAVVAIIDHWDDIKSGLSSAWGWIKKWVLYPIRDFFTKTVPGWATGLKDAMVGAFEDARDGIKGAWDGLKKIARAPIQYVVDIVYNKGIVGVWNNVATAFGADPLKEFHFARGGVMPGYTPGRDVHNFVSPTGGRLALSGGEAIMRPEFTRAVGSGFVHSMNAIARSRGAQGIKAALAPVFGGNPQTPTDTTLRYADGGIFGWIGGAANKIAGAGSAAWNKIKEGASWLKDTLAASARAGVENVVDPLLKRFPGMDTMFGKALRRIPTKMIDALFGYSKEADKKGGSGLGGPKIKAATRWAKAQAGKPYIWGGVGPKGFDCSGFMGAIENVIRGQKPNRRRWATGAFSGNTAPAGWVKNGDSAFRIGITNAGVGHTAGTIGKTKVESRGGDGVVVGAGARGYNSSLFTDWYGFQPGKYDQGGYLQPGLNLAYNGTGRPEPVFTTSQANALTSMAAKGPQQPVVVELHAQESGFGQLIDVRVQQHDQALISVLNAS
jgi:hypothetical protein